MQTAYIQRQMESSPLFQGVSGDGLQTLAARARYRTFKAGEEIVGERDPVRAFYVVLSGQVKLYKSSSEGKEQTLYLLGPGEPFGLCTAFAVESFPASVSALEESSVIFIPGPDVEAIARREPALLLSIIQVLSRRLKETMNLVESLALQEIPQRLAAFLLHGLSRRGMVPENRVQLTTTHRELAKILGVTPEALSRALKKMAGEGILTVDGRMITVLDRETLADIAAGE
jgi:CRP/FNR family transcriptional regulator